MQCPNCYASYAADDPQCRECGADLPRTSASTSLVATQSRLPAVLHNPQLPRLAAGVGALAVGVGLELLRRGVLTRMARVPAVVDQGSLPVLGGLKDMLTPQSSKTTRLPKGYEVQETVVYMRRVIRRQG